MRVVGIGVWFSNLSGRTKEGGIETDIYTCSKNGFVRYSVVKR